MHPQSSSTAARSRGLAREGATWSVAADRLRAIRELVAQSGDARWLVAFDIDGDDAWLQSPANANGMGQALAALSSRLNAKLDLQLERAHGGQQARGLVALARRQAEA